MYFLAVDVCAQIGPIVSVVKTVFRILQWAIPIVLILFGAVDLGKAVIAGKEDEMKKAQSTLIKRLIYAVLIFFVFTIVSLVMALVGGSKDERDPNATITGADWAACWNKY